MRWRPAWRLQTGARQWLACAVPRRAQLRIDWAVGLPRAGVFTVQCSNIRTLLSFSGTPEIQKTITTKMVLGW